MLWLRREPNGNHREIGLTWWEWSRFQRDRFARRCRSPSPFVATHNHFVLDRGGKVFNRSAPVIKLPAGATEEDHLALLGVLNSSTACFWMKQVFHNKGGGTDSGKMQSDLAKVAHEFTTTGLENMPIPELGTNRARIVHLARAVDLLATERSSILSEVLPSIDALRIIPIDELVARISEARERERLLLAATEVGLQEELDWLVYRAFGLVEQSARRCRFST